MKRSLKPEDLQSMFLKNHFLLCFLLLCWTLCVAGLYVCVQFTGETCQASFFQSWCNRCCTTPVLVRTRKHTGQKEKTKVTTHRQNMAVTFSMLCPAAMFSWWPLFWDNTIEMGRVANSLWTLLIKAVLKISSRTIQLDSFLYQLLSSVDRSRREL